MEFASLILCDNKVYCQLRLLNKKLYAFATISIAKMVGIAIIIKFLSLVK